MTSGTSPAIDAAEEEYYRRLDQLNVIPYWRMEGVQGQLPPGPTPYRWRWKELYPALADSVELIDVGRGAAERRVITMANPGERAGRATHTLTCSLQMIMAGEVAPAHRHSFAAFRFIITGRGAYTVVNGEKCPMEMGDLILTPGWCWHDHGSDGSEPMVWLDGLDVPLVAKLRASFYEEFPGGLSQPVTQDQPSPGLLFKWGDALDAVRHAPETEQDGKLLEYTNPSTGGHIMPTLACYLQSLRPGFHTRARRDTASRIFFVARGSGRSIIGDEELTWEQNDIIAVPNWTSYEHIAGSEEAILFSYSDQPTLEALQLYRAEATTS